MRILHMSDTHGLPPSPEGDYDVIVHSGDMLPNRTFGIKPVEHEFQKHWVHENLTRLHPRYWSKPFLYCPGNHDYYDPTPFMREIGIDARLICNNGEEVGGVLFYGFPWTPTFFDWNWMCGPEEMRHHLESVPSVDVLVGHGPVHGVLDRNRQGERCGSREVRKYLQNVVMPPKLFLHGHIHEAAGMRGWSRGIVVSNAACIQQIVEVK